MSQSSRFSGRDLLHSILIGLVMTAILVGIGLAVSSSRGIPRRAQTTDGTPGAVAILPTAIPPTATPTEIPCTAQEWWNSISAATAATFDNVRTVTADTPVPQVQVMQADFKVWKSNLELAAKPPPCAEAAQQSLLTAAGDIEANYQLYVSASSDQQRAQQFLKLSDSILLVTDELEKLEVVVTEDWLLSVREFVRGECPATRWFIDIWRGRNYQQFPVLLNNINPQTATPAQLQETLLEMRNYANAFRTDRASFPECVATAADHWSKALDAAVNMVNSALNGDLNGVNNNLVTYQGESTAFFAEVKRLIPDAEV
jgi:hypothetical protein